MSDRVETDPEAPEAGGRGPEPAGAETRHPLPEPGIEAFSRMEVRAGIFVLVATVILGFFYFFGKEVTTLFQPHKNIVSYFNDISGLEEGAAVRYARLTGGKVTDNRIGGGQEHKIEVDLSVLSYVPLREGTVASIRATELVIGKYVDLSGGDPDAPPLPDDAVVPGSQEPTLDEVLNSAGRIILNLREIVDQVSLIFKEQNVESLMANLNRMTELAAGEGDSIMVNLRDTMQRLNEAGVVEELIDITNTISENKDKIVSLVEQANRLAIDTNSMLLGQEKQISSLLDDLSKLSGAFADDAVPLARNLTALAGRTSSVSEDLPGLIQDTETILGKLDRTLTSLNKILARTENITENDIRQFVQHEGMRIYFSERKAPKLKPEPEEAGTGE